MAQDPEPIRIKVKTKEEEPPPPEKKFLETLPGMLTAIGGVIAAVATLITALSSAGLFAADPTATPMPATITASTHTVTLTPTASATLTPTAPFTATPEALPTETFTIPPTVTPLPPTATIGPLYGDDFENTQSGWFIEETDEYAMGYVNGAYYIRVKPAEYDVWVTTDGVKDARDLIVQVMARHAAGPADNDFGLLVRYDETQDSCYMFAISSDGYYVAQRYENPDWQVLVPWTPSSAIKQGLGSENHLRVECDGPAMRFFVNGVLLTTVEDRTDDRGSIGLIAGTGAEGDVTIHFDDLVVNGLP